jgi:hypothetical protein
VKDVLLIHITKKILRTWKSWREKTSPKLVHSDLYTMNHPSFACARYVLTFINDSSKFTWVYFFKTRTWYLIKFKDFRKLTKKQMWSTHEMFDFR